MGAQCGPTMASSYPRLALPLLRKHAARFSTLPPFNIPHPVQAVSVAGYMAFGNAVPGNILNAFDQPRWVIDMANIMVVIHMIPAYQVYSQPFLAFSEYHYNQWRYAPSFFKVCWASRCGWEGRDRDMRCLLPQSAPHTSPSP